MLPTRESQPSRRAALPLPPGPPVASAAAAAFAASAAASTALAAAAVASACADAAVAWAAVAAAAIREPMAEITRGAGSSREQAIKPMPGIRPYPGGYRRPWKLGNLNGLKYCAPIVVCWSLVDRILVNLKV